MDYREFLELATRSRLLTRADLLSLRKDFAELRKRPTSDQERFSLLRNHLIEKGLLTEWQCEMLENRIAFYYFIGKYKVLELISFDGIACLYVAEDTESHDRVQITMTRDADILPFAVTKAEQIIERGTLRMAGRDQQKDQGEAE